MRKHLMLALALTLIACGGDSTAPKPVARTAVLSYAKCGTEKVGEVVKNKYNVTVSWDQTFGQSWRALFVRNSGLLVTDITDAASSKASGCIYLSGDHASAYLFIGSESTLTDEVLLSP